MVFFKGIPLKVQHIFPPVIRRARTRNSNISRFTVFFGKPNVPYVISSPTLCFSGAMTRRGHDHGGTSGHHSGSRSPGLILETTMRRRLMPIVLAVALLVPQYAFTWNSRGHMMVVAVAYQKLNQATKDRVDTLLLLNPDRDTGWT
jgi:hypothetical protein